MMNIGLYMHPNVTHHSVGSWMHPLNMTMSAHRWDRPEPWQRVAQTAERGRLDFVFFADIESVPAAYGGNHDASVRYALQSPNFEPMQLLSFMAAVTSDVGLAGTMSTEGYNPFTAARIWSTFDHLTNGRAGWNVVTGAHMASTLNLGLERIEKEQRYERADEYLEVCNRLWESWEEDAVVMDVEGRTFAEPKRVHAIDHVGTWFRSKGPLNIHRSPQVRPVMIQAGASPSGLAFAGKHAEVTFAIQNSVEGMRKYRDRLRGAASAAGRDPDQVKALFAFQPIVGETEEIAQAKAAFHDRLVEPEAGLAFLAGHLGVDLSVVDLDQRIDELDVPGVQGLVDSYMNSAEFTDAAVRDLAAAHGQRTGVMRAVGTGEQVAQRMIDVCEQVGGDGFMLSPIYLPGMFEDFVDLVVPHLQAAGAFRTEYLPGGLRSNLFA